MSKAAPPIINSNPARKTATGKGAIPTLVMDIVRVSATMRSSGIR
jgi:hypothetical protein